ncbi:hypothetical protein quinque_004641 [Culex quinquefasciatus]
MKFGNYNLTAPEPATTRHRHLFLFRIRKVKSTAHYIVGRVHRKIGTVKRKMRQPEQQPVVVPVAVCEEEQEIPPALPLRNQHHPGTAIAMGRSESPLSYRASLFGAGSDRNRSSIASRTKFSPQDFPATWLEGGNEMPCFGLGHQDESFQVFSNKAHLFHKNKTISGRRPLFVKNFQPFNSLQREPSLAKSGATFGSCPEINSGTLKSQLSQKSKNSQNSKRSYRSNRSSWRFKSKIVQLLEKNNDEKTEMEILQDYLDTMSYTDIIKDKDFKNYLIKKNYKDIMEYIYSSESEFGASEVHSSPPSVLVSNNDCDSVKKEKLAAEIPRKYYSFTNPQVFCKRDQNFERYYQKYGTVPPKVFGYSSLPTQYYSQTPPINDVSQKEDIPCYVTLPKKTSRCKRTYQQVREFCEKSLLKYTSSKPTNETLKLQKPSKEFSEKAYSRVITDFVRKRGFDTVESYIQYYYGDFLNRKPFRPQTKQTQFNSLPPPPYSSGEFHEDQLRSLDSKPTPSSTPAAAANDSGIECSSNFTSLIYSDSFKNFDYVNLTTMSRKHRRPQSSSACCNLNEKPRIFRPVDSDDEDEDENRFTSHVLLDGLIATSDQTNLPYIFDDIGIYESIKSTQKERFRAEVRSRKDSFVIEKQQQQGSPPTPAKTLPTRFVNGRKLLNERAVTVPTECCGTPSNGPQEGGYRDEMLSEEMSSLVPPGLQGKADILFGNLHELYTFHNDIFLKDLENCISTTELVALCFVQRRDTFFRLYSYYCQNIPRSERLRETLVDTHLFLQECQKKLGHKLPLAAYLLKPVQRITKYQLLLKDLLK